jgi:hypothetical protein
MRKEVLATARASEWFEDVITALKEVFSSWIQAYAINKNPQIEDNTLDYRTVANDIRQASQYTTNKLSKVTKGSFGPRRWKDKDTEMKSSNASHGSLVWILLGSWDYYLSDRKEEMIIAAFKHLFGMLK